MRRISRTGYDEGEKEVVIDDECNNLHCKVKSKSLRISQSSEEELINIPKATYVKIPVLLSSFKLNLTLSTIQQFKAGIVALKRVKRRIELQECRVVRNTGVIFIQGVVKEDIELVLYGRSRLEHRSCLIPFSCVTNIKYIRDPIYFRQYYSTECDLEAIYNDEDSELISVTEECVDDELYCELNKNIIREVTKVKDGKGKLSKNNTIENLLDIELFIKLFQKQLVKL